MEKYTKMELMKITNLGHASFKIDGEQFSIIFDPYQDGSVPGLTFPRNLKADHVFISHQHADHNAIELVDIVERNKTIKYKEISIPHDKENGSLRGLCKAYVVEVDGYKIGHLGDIGDISSPLLNGLKNLL